MIINLYIFDTALETTGHFLEQHTPKYKINDRTLQNSNNYELLILNVYIIYMKFGLYELILLRYVYIIYMKCVLYEPIL